jgi:hypothetical protein
MNNYKINMFYTFTLLGCFYLVLQYVDWLTSIKYNIDSPYSKAKKNHNTCLYMT